LKAFLTYANSTVCTVVSITLSLYTNYHCKGHAAADTIRFQVEHSIACVKTDVL